MLRLQKVNSHIGAYLLEVVMGQFWKNNFYPQSGLLSKKFWPIPASPTVIFVCTRMQYILVKLVGTIFPNYKEISNLKHSDPDHDEPTTGDEWYTPIHSHANKHDITFSQDPSLNALLQ